MSWTAMALLLLILVGSDEAQGRVSSDCSSITADLNGDRGVTFDDFFFLADHFGDKSEIARTDSTGRYLNLKMLFHSAGGGDFYLINADGSNLVRIGEDRGSPTLLVSPNGNKVVYVDESGDNERLYTMDFDGTALVKVAGDFFAILDISWFPAGKKLFLSARDVGQGQREDATVYTLDLSDPNQAQLRQLAVSYGGAAMLSPDGKKVLLRNGTIVHIDDNSSCESPVIATDLRGGWSYDSRYVAVDGYSSNGEEVTFVYDADCSNPTKVAGIVLNASWSPTEPRLYFVSSDTATPEVPDIFGVNADGTALKNYTNNDGTTESIIGYKLSPDGTQLAYSQIERRSSDSPLVGSWAKIKMIDLSSIDLSPVVIFDSSPKIASDQADVSWSPDGKWLSYRLNNVNFWCQSMISDSSYTVALEGIIKKAGSINPEITQVFWYEPNKLAGDFNNDGTVNFDDFFILADQFGMKCD